jgi:methionine synthase II (cobalamin-independent)
MFKINAGYFLIQLASERDKDPVYESIGQHSRDDQMCYIGVTVTQSPRPESAQEICDQLVRAADFIPKERLGSTDDCGFSPFSIDEKPNHGSPDYAREIAFQKIANRVQGTRMAAEKLGVG